MASRCRVAVFVCLAAACSSSATAPGHGKPSPSFALAFDRDAVSVEAGTSAGTLFLSASVSGTLPQPISISIDGLPAGVVSTPAQPFKIRGSRILLGFDIAANAAPGHYELTFNGSSGSFAASQTLSMDVVPHTSMVGRNAYLRLADAPLQNTHAIDSATYDPPRHRAFLVDHLRNAIDVVAMDTVTLERRIPVPGPLSARLTPDGTRVVVGTRTDQAILIDPDRLEVVDRKIFPVTTIQGQPARSPWDIAPTATGNWLVGSPSGAAVEKQLVEWNVEAGTTIDRTAWMFGAIQFLLPNARGTRVLIAGFSKIALYDSSCDCITGTVDGGAVAGGWRSEDQFVVSEQSTWIIYDSALHEVARVPALMMAGAAVYDLTGAHLFFVDQQTNLLTALDTASYSPLGIVPLELAGAGTPLLADDQSRVLVAVDRGVAIVDGTNLVAASSARPSLFINGSGSADGSTTIAAGLGDHTAPTSISFGSVSPFGPFSCSGSSLVQCDIQPPAGQGVVDVSASFPNGWSSLNVDGYSYGPTVLFTQPSGGSLSGGAKLDLVGYGLTAPGLAITVGGIAAEAGPVQTDASGQSRPQMAQVAAPPVTRPGKVPITVSTAYGGFNLNGGFQYLDITNVTLASAPFDLVYDRWRGVVYVSEPDAGLVQIVSVASRAVSGEIRAASRPAGISLAPDGSALAVADFATNQLLLVDPDHTDAAPRSFDPLDPADTDSDPHAFSVAFAAGKVFVGIYRTQATGCFQKPGVREIDLLSGAVRSPDLGFSCSSEQTSVDASPDGTRVVAIGQGNNGGNTSTWNASTDSFSARSFNYSLTRASLSDGGTMLPEFDFYGFLMLDRHSTLRTVEAGVQFVDTAVGSSFPNFILHRSGSVAYAPMGGNGGAGLGIADAQTGTLRSTWGLPLPPLSTWGPIAIDDWGQKVFLSSASGVIIVDLGKAPLGIGYLDPDSIPAAGGTMVQIHGSGFVAGATVSIAGTAATTSYVDANTLSFAAPAGTAGSARLELVNGDGETYSLDAALSYSN